MTKNQIETKIKEELINLSSIDWASAACAFLQFILLEMKDKNVPADEFYDFFNTFTFNDKNKFINYLTQLLSTSDSTLASFILQNTTTIEINDENVLFDDEKMKNVIEKFLKYLESKNIPFAGFTIANNADWFLNAQYFFKTKNIHLGGFVQTAVEIEK